MNSKTHLASVLLPVWIALACVFVITTSGCKTLLAKVNVTEYRLLDTPDNRVMAIRCVGVVARQYGLETYPRLGLVCYGDTDGKLEVYAVEALDGFESQDFTNLDSLKVGFLHPTNSIMHFIRDNLSSNVIAELTNYSAGDDSRLRSNLASNMNSIICMHGLLYKRERFEGINLSEKTKELLAEKPIGKSLCRLNRMLLDDVFQEKVRPMGNDTIRVTYAIQSSGFTKRHLDIENYLTHQMEWAFGGQFKLTRYAYWIP
jgi:hypothetical protein